MENNLQDCYFFYYSSCTKGDECSYRHCQEALGSETVCTNWKRGMCTRSNCKFRHMESRIDRKSIPCYWENQPGGCRKPHCVFFHRKLKTGILQANEKQGLILPVGGKISPVPSTALNSKNESSPNSNLSRNDISPDETDEGIHIPFEPLVVSFDENEESDSESITSTPVKLNEKKVLNSNLEKSNLLSKFTEKATGTPFDFKVKSLEEIRLAKIHKESENIFKTDYQVPSLEDYKKANRPNLDTVPSIEDRKYLTLDFDGQMSSMDKIPNQHEHVLLDGAVITENIETSHSPLKKDDLRSRLQRRNWELFQLRKKQACGSSINVKSLAQIHKEKELRKAKSIQENGTSIAVADKTLPASNIIRPPVTTMQSNPLRKLKIQRKDITSTPKENLINTGKRKNSEDTDSVKIVKVDSSASEDKCELNRIQQKQEFQKQPVDRLLPFLKRKSDASCPSECSSTSGSNLEDVIVDSSEKKIQEIHSDEATLLQNNIVNSIVLTVEVEADGNNTFEMDSIAEAASHEGRNNSPDSTKTTSTNINTVNRSISIDEIDHFLKDTDVDMDDLEETGDGGEDDIMLKINEFLDS